MSKTYLYLLATSLFLCCNIASGQVFPAENTRLHYTMIGFFFPENISAKKYCIQIAEGRIYDEADFVRKIFINDTCISNRSIIRVPEWGKEYTWSAIPQRYEPTNGKWRYSLQYRASMITSKNDVERMIWYGQKNTKKTDIAYE